MMQFFFGFGDFLLFVVVLCKEKEETKEKEEKEAGIESRWGHEIPT